MPSNFSVSVTANFTAIPSTSKKFSGNFLSLASEVLTKTALEKGAESCQPEALTPDEVVMKVTGPVEQLSAALEAMDRRMSQLSEHGQYADILELLLSKHPELRKHPRYNELVGTFDLLCNKVKEIIKDSNPNPTRVVPPMARSEVDETQTKAARVQAREEALRKPVTGD